jgi:hypothetical protein
MSLSFSTTKSGRLVAPALFSASKAMPAVIAPSPITATARCFEPVWRNASAMPSAAEMDVLE